MHLQRLLLTCVLLWLGGSLWAQDAREPGGADPLRDFIRGGKTVEVEPEEDLPRQREVLEATDADAGRDALPGVMLLSNGKKLPGRIFTTRFSPLVVYVEPEKRFRRIPLPAVLSIRAVVVEERMQLEWRWKAMGVPERVYTGRKFPSRRLLWKVRLIDGTVITGAIKGDPLWVQVEGRGSDPLVLHERQKGKPGQSHKDLLYIRHIVFSRELMERVLARQKAKASHESKNKSDAEDP
jgi:hypothetical protein